VGKLCVMPEPAAEATIAAAAELVDELIVVGSRGLGPVRRLLLGSVSDAIVHHARRAVLVMRGGDQAWPPRLVIAADDGDDATWPALRRAAAVAHLVEARLELVQVVPPTARFSHMSEQEALADVKAHLNTRAGRLAYRLGSQPGTEVRIGDPATELLEVSSHKGCLLVAGSHGRSTLNRLRLGSVSTNLVHAAECPVLVVPAAGPR
jgi:nucleotide-binding universal stress UspA family protein